MNLFSDYKYSENSKEKPFLITWVTHNSRINNHLIEIGITELNPVILSENEQEIITNAIEYVKNNKIKHQEKENLLKNK